MKRLDQLSDGDSRVLSYIFDPESAPSATLVIDSKLPADSHIRDPVLLSQLKARELQAIRHVEFLSSSEGDVDETTKQNAFMKASEDFSLLIEEQPTYASAFNNRAQLCRWRFGDHMLVQPSKTTTPGSFASIVENTIQDLNTAIKLATPSSPSDPVSPGQARLLAQAHTQRATFLYTASKDLKAIEASSQSESERSRIPKFPPYGNYTVEMFEDASARDFF